MIEIATRAISTRIRISATEIIESPTPGAFAAAVRQDWTRLFDDCARREHNAWAGFLGKDGHGILCNPETPLWLRLPEGL